MTIPIKDPGTDLNTTEQRKVQEFHRNDDFNSRDEAHHHGLGMTHEKGAWGDHTHDGNTGRALLEGITFTGSRSSNGPDIINQICNALAQFGAVNSTGA